MVMKIILLGMRLLSYFSAFPRFLPDNTTALRNGRAVYFILF